MAPIICCSLDAQGNGIPGIRVLLQCCNDIGRPNLQFFAYTGIDGVIRVWFPVIYSINTFYEPVYVDAFDFPSIQISYLTAGYFGADVMPWVDLSANIQLTGHVQHLISLQMSEDTSRFSIQHTCQPLDQWTCPCPFCKCDYMQLEAVDTDQEIETSSVGTCNQELQSLSASSLGCWSLSRGLDSNEDPLLLPNNQIMIEEDIAWVINRKRKAGYCESELPPTKRRRLGGRKCSIAETI